MANDEQVPKIVVDTNVLVSGIINPFGLPRQLLDAWDAERLELLTSTELIDEVVRVLHRSRIRTKYGVTSERITTLHTRLERTATVVTPLPSLLLSSRDPKDDKFLAVAVAGSADYLVTGDDDLLTLNGNPALHSLQINFCSSFPYYPVSFLLIIAIHPFSISSASPPNMPIRAIALERDLLDRSR